MKIAVKKAEEVVEEVVKEVEQKIEPINETPKTESQTSFIDKTPSNWIIKPTEDGIEARNTATSQVFIGSMVDFNKNLRG